MDPKTIRQRVEDSDWRITPYRNGNSPSFTFKDIVSDCFDNVKRIGRGAVHYNLKDMYTPELGDLRRSKSYSILSPTHGMKKSLRHVSGDLREFKAYNPHQSEYRLVAAKSTGQRRPVPSNLTADRSQLPLAPTCRRQYPVPADNTRYENFAIYWGGRARGLDYSDPFLHDKHYDVYEITEDRRYNRLYWSPQFLPFFPSARHGRQIMLATY
ncbi:hypothetical protein M3Y98_00545900 [Aphelenchoides besseyi]|nr:hypothetical protein M3Y98_00545900 [Aphelenchoides besseyi]KAI6208178.1 hypothetical protein M3Y96_00087400 [Aphelenchoides besseyi]